MGRAWTRFRTGSAPLWCAAFLGALAGVMVTQPFAEACDCTPPAWRLTLAANDSDAAALGWPRVARLEPRAGTVIVWSEDFTTGTIDHLHAGGP